MPLNVEFCDDPAMLLQNHEAGEFSPPATEGKPTLRPSLRLRLFLPFASASAFASFASSAP